MATVTHRAANKQPTEWSRETARGISNRPLDGERDSSRRVPPRQEGVEGPLD